MVLAEIHLPKQAPERFKDRETLWNEVEWIEGNKKAQLAHSFDIALMNEFSMEENIELARRFVEEQLVARGMIADLAIHDSKKAKDKIPKEYESETICRDDPLSGRAGCENSRTADRENPGIRYSAKRGKSAVESTTVCSAKYQQQPLCDERVF